MWKLADPETDDAETEGETVKSVEEAGDEAEPEGEETKVAEDNAEDTVVDDAGLESGEEKSVDAEESDVNSQEIPSDLEAAADATADELAWYWILIIILASTIIVIAIAMTIMAYHCNHEYLMIKKMMCSFCLKEDKDQEPNSHEYTMLSTQDDEEERRESYGAIASLEDNR